jgi:aldose 1-epimerase
MRATEQPGAVARDVFGHLPDGRAVERVLLRGMAGFEVSIITYGAAVQSLLAPDRDGRLADVVLGHDTIEPYLARRDFFGATVGRYANRIAGAAFMLDGVYHQLSANDGRNTLHGGTEGFDRALWSIDTIGSGPEPFVVFSRESPDGENGFPGTLLARVTYQVSGGQTLTITLEATTNRPTFVNLTHHGYFNLGGGAQAGDILDHELTLFADRFLPIDAELIPLPEALDVAGTPFDFRSPRLIGARIREGHQQLRLAHGYDHCFVLGRDRSASPRLAARAVHPASGRAFDLMTDQPGIQFYSGNFLDGSVAGKHGSPHRQSDAFCLEPQCWPDAPNRPDFPSARLNPGETYRHVSSLRFHTV